MPILWAPMQLEFNPADNDILGKDSNPAVGIVELVNSTLTYFDIQVIDSSQVGNLPLAATLRPLTVANSESPRRRGRRYLPRSRLRRCPRTARVRAILRAKYHLPDEAISQLEAHFALINEKYHAAMNGDPADDSLEARDA